MRAALLLAVLALSSLSRADDPSTQDHEIDDRDKRQTQPFYTGGLTGFRPTPKPQPFTGGLQQTNLPRFQGLLSASPQGFRTVTPVDEDADDIDRNTVSPTPQPLVLRPQHNSPQPTQYRPAPSPTPQVVLRSRPQTQQSEYRRPQQQQQQQQQHQQFRANPQQQLTEEQLEELEEEKEEPDRLTVLLPQSKFDCHGLKTGYYADEGLNCEVFHYCQDNARHSWICPEGFLFHQVHLICMPPSSDNICQQSSQYHFVNDFLYKPINQEEFEKKPNVTLRYSDRYYPENYYEEGQAYESRPVPVKASRPVQQQQHQQPASLRPSPSPQQFRVNQVFHSPEEVNIPLQHRRPVTQPQRTFPTTNSEEYEY